MAYGVLFGVSPTLVADTFGTGGLSQNWGFMTLGPAVFSEVFNLIYGKIYDAHSDKGASKHSKCAAGKDCYKIAYMVTFIAGLIGMAVTLWCIRHRHVKESRLRKEEEGMDEDHIE